MKLLVCCVVALSLIRRRATCLCCVFPVAVLCVTTVFAGGPGLFLAVQTGEELSEVACVPLALGTPITLEFVNSIYRAPVRETLRYEPGEGFILVLVESPSAGVFEYYGLEADGTGRAIMRKKVDSVRIKSNDYRDHRLVVGDVVLDFREFAVNGEPVYVKVFGGLGCKRANTRETPPMR